MFHLHLLSTLMLPSSSTPSHPCTERPLFHRSAVPPGQTSSKIKVDRPLKNEGTPVGEHTVYIFTVAAGFPFEVRSYEDAVVLRSFDRGLFLNRRGSNLKVNSWNLFIELNGHELISLEDIIIRNSFSSIFFNIHTFYNSSWSNSDFIKCKNPHRYDICSNFFPINISIFFMIYHRITRIYNF